jgi:hypothetical protein
MNQRVLLPVSTTLKQGANMSKLSFGAMCAIATINARKWEMVQPTSSGKNRFQEKLNRGKRKKKSKQ